MKLDLTRYRKPFAQFAHTFRPDEMGDERDTYRVAEPVALAFDIHKDKDKFRLEGTVRTGLELPCSRCLEPFRLPVDSSFDLRYLPASEASTEAEQEVGEGDLETSYYRDEEIDLDELMREQFYLALPMKPLCRDACKGLCPHCGTNLNASSCDCAPASQDPRLAPLRELGKVRGS